ncbi:MAG: hypothetical protein GY953_07140, partial [bacterium]|nr:hypothetical protein [bacterium]
MSQTGQLPALKESPPTRAWTPAIWGLAGLVAGLLLALLLAPSGDIDLSSYEVRPLATDSAIESTPSWSPDGESVAYRRVVDDRSQLFVRSLGSPTPLQLTNFPERVDAPLIWTPDGASIYFRSSDGIWLVGAAGGEPQHVLKTPQIADATLSPDGETLAVWTSTESDDGVVSSLWMSSPPGAELVRYEPSPFEVNGRWSPIFIKFSPDGSTILHTMITNEGAVAWRIPFPPGSGEEPKRVFESFFGGTPFSPEFSWLPDNEHIVLSASGGLQRLQRLWIGNLSNGQARQITGGFGQEREPAVSPDGEKIVFAASTMDFNIVELPLDGSPVRDLLATSRDEFFAVWSPVREQFVYVTDREGSSAIWLRNVAEGTDRPLVAPDDFP